MIREQNIQTLSSDIAAINQKFPAIVPFEREVANLKLVELSGENFMQGMR